MDNGLRRWNRGERVPENILDTDLPRIAWAITAVVRGQATTFVQSPKNLRYVRIICPVGPEVCIRKEHWVRILPLIQDGTFNPLLFPVEAGFKEFDPAVHLCASTSKSRDPLYSRVFFYLSQLFLAKVPTGNL